MEYAKIQSRYCVNQDCHRIVGRYLRELEREEIRVTRLQTKYDLWASRLGYWVDLYHIIGRMGLPYEKKGVSIISVVMDAPMSCTSALSGKLGMIDGVTAKCNTAKI